MISFNFDVITKKTGKSLAQIARETGLNRNTIQAMSLGKINGITFKTLNILCKTFDVLLSDLIVYEKEKEESKKSTSEIYRQEGESVPFTIFYGGIIGSRILNPKTQEPMFRKFDCFFQEQYGFLYFPEKQLRQSAYELYEYYRQDTHFRRQFALFESAAKKMESLYLQVLRKPVSGELEILKTVRALESAYDAFWESSIFIDCFDVGVDQEIVHTIAKKYGFSQEEVAILTTPESMTFSNERRFILLRFVFEHKWKTREKEEILKKIMLSPDMIAFQATYDVVKTNYGQVSHVSFDDIADEVLGIFEHETESRKELEQLQTYFEMRRKKNSDILRIHKLSENPLWFFARLTAWREARKFTNLMGFHIIDKILSAIECEVGIPVRYLHYVMGDEISLVLHGAISLDELKYRREKGGLVSFKDGSYTLYKGEQASALRDELESAFHEEISVQNISGQTACQGYAKGIARIILDISQFDQLNEGEILITGMTRPEFLPIMKKAAAIVTNEGGITCHAAIVSRELGKPCIIGTKNATARINNGDLIEVRANHGTVRILSKNE